MDPMNLSASITVELTLIQKDLINQRSGVADFESF